MALSDHPDLKKSLTPPLIIHTAATPMPMPKSAMFGDAAQGYESRRASSVSMDPSAHEFKSPVGTSFSLFPFVIASFLLGLCWGGQDAARQPILSGLWNP